MGKKKKALLELHRLGKVRKKWEAKFARLLEANLASIKKTAETVAEKVEETLAKTEEPIIKTSDVEKTPKKKATRTQPEKKVTTTKKTTSSRKRRTTKTKTVS